jgi:hypothetical protein
MKTIVILLVILSIGVGTAKEDGFGPFEWPWEAFFDMLETMMNDMTQVILGAMQRKLPIRITNVI